MHIKHFQWCAFFLFFRFSNFHFWKVQILTITSHFGILGIFKIFKNLKFCELIFFLITTLENEENDVERRNFEVAAILRAIFSHWQKLTERWESGVCRIGCIVGPSGNADAKRRPWYAVRHWPHLPIIFSMYLLPYSWSRFYASAVFRHYWANLTHDSMVSKLAYLTGVAMVSGSCTYRWLIKHARTKVRRKMFHWLR